MSFTIEDAKALLREEPANRVVTPDLFCDMVYMCKDGIRAMTVEEAREIIDKIAA